MSESGVWVPTTSTPRLTSTTLGEIYEKTGHDDTAGRFAEKIIDPRTFKYGGCFVFLKVHLQIDL